MNKEECELAARKCYEGHLGLILAADFIIASNGREEVQIYGMNKPIHVRVKKTASSNLQIWEDNILSTSWECDIVAEIDEDDLVHLSDGHGEEVRWRDFRTFFVDGPRYSLESNECRMPYWGYAGYQDDNLSEAAQETLADIDWRKRVEQARFTREKKAQEAINHIIDCQKNRET